MRAEDLPRYKDLPIITPPHYRGTWGLFDNPSSTPNEDGTNGPSKPHKDSLGTLNLLTPPVVAAASREIRAGVSVSLNWGLEKVHEPAVGRARFSHRIIDLGKAMGAPFYSWDDEISINTQAGSQWDGLRHWGHADTGMYYNGTHHDEVIASPWLGIEHINRRGGIVGRGVLLDYVAYAEMHGVRYDPMSRHGILVRDLEAMAAEQKVEFCPGDILIVRTGWIKWYEEHGEEERVAKITKGGAWVGVEGCEETLEWLWDHHFAAVAGDSIGWEVWPNQEGWRLHDHLLAMWGMPLGEMWDLEALAKECEKQQRWTFFFTSAPLNVTGGIASPPNALAIF